MLMSSERYILLLSRFTAADSIQRIGIIRTFFTSSYLKYTDGTSNSYWKWKKYMREWEERKTIKGTDWIQLDTSA